MKSTVIVSLCFVFGIFGNVNTDQPKVEGVGEGRSETKELEKAGRPDERAGYVPRPGQSLGRPNPLNMVVCYACTNCRNVAPNTNSKLCPYSPDTQKQGKCVVYAERLGVQSSDLVYIRGCASDRGTCGEIKKAYEHSGKYVELVSCSECQGDKCNGAPKSMVDLTVAFITVAVLPLLGKYSLS